MWFSPSSNAPRAASPFLPSPGAGPAPPLLQSSRVGSRTSRSFRFPGRRADFAKCRGFPPPQKKHMLLTRNSKTLDPCMPLTHTRRAGEAPGDCAEPGGVGGSRAGAGHTLAGHPVSARGGRGGLVSTTQRPVSSEGRQAAPIREPANQRRKASNRTVTLGAPFT